MENKFSAKLGKAIREANAIVKGAPKPEPEAPKVVATYSVIKVFRGEYRKIAFGVPRRWEAQMIADHARKEMIPVEDVGGDAKFESPTYRVVEE